MIVDFLRKLRLGLRGTAFGRLLRGLGVQRLGKRLYERRVLRRGFLEGELLGARLRFTVRTAREITRIDAFYAEEAFVERMAEALRDGDVFFDIGANIGLVCLPLARRFAGRGICVHAFEPEAGNARDLRENARLNDLTDVHVHEAALSDSDGTMSLYLDGEVGSGAHSLIAGHSAATQTVSVPVTTAAGFADRHGLSPAVVKIDVEGAEMAVLAGMEPLLLNRSVRALFIEVHPDTLRRAGQSRAGLEQWLNERGYVLLWSQERGRQVHQHYQREKEPDHSAVGGKGESDR